MQILRPECLWLLLVLGALWWWHQRSLAPLRGHRKLAAFLARGLVVVAIIFALSEPRWMATTTKQEVLLLVDQSASVGASGVEAASKFLETADFGSAEVAWIGFGEKGRIFKTFDDLKNADPGLVENGGTRLDNVLGLASAAFRPGRVKSLVVFSDGVNTGGPPAIDSLRASDIRVHAVPVIPPDLPEVLVRHVNAPGSVRKNEPLSLKASLRSTRVTGAKVGLFRNGIRVSSRHVNLAVGDNDITFEDRAGDEKLLHYEVLVESDQDTIAENNLAGTAVLSEGPSRILLLTDRPESARYLEWALRQEGLELSVRPAQGAPTRMDDLQNFDGLIMDNIPASDLTREQMELFQAYVRDFGGGLLMLGGDQAYGLGGYFRTPVEDLLPVSCDFSKEEEAPSLALALVIDRSGSMSGEKMELAKAAAKASADLLGPKDYISVVAFDSEAYPVVPIQSAGNTASIAAEIASITEGGGTDIAVGMEEALRQLNGNDDKIKHVIILTDGVSNEGPFYELTSEMVRGNITASTVGVGEGADMNLLTQIAQWGNGRSYQSNDPSTIPQIFTKETMTASKSAIQEFPFLAKPVRAIDFLEGVPWDEAPFLLGYVRTKPKPTSETWLITERGDPLLTTWRYGLGTTAAFTSDARNRWAVEWLRWPGFGKFWSQLLRRMSRPASLGLTEVELTNEANKVLVTVNALDSEELFPSNASGTLKLSDPSGKVSSIPLQKVLPGRWIATIPHVQRGITSGQIVLEKNGEPFDARFFTVSRGYSQELLLEPPDTNFLKTLTEKTGGTNSPDPATIFQTDTRTASMELELWPWLLLVALMGLVCDVGIRRWPT
ncbi:MAG: VWA domain-containing protein [Terrimicrobiaceae bacterium]